MGFTQLLRFLGQLEKQKENLKSGSKSVSKFSLTPCHAMSGDSQTLENTSSNVIVKQDASGEIIEVGDEGLEVFGSYPLFNRLRPVLVKQLGAHTGANLPLSQVVALLIERWDHMTPEEQGMLIGLIKR